MKKEIIFVKGDLLKDPADMLVNTVNCVGVMGKGIALAYKNAFPHNFRAYQKICSANRLKPGGVFIFTEQNLLGKTVIINMATKYHWRALSRYEWIEKGLDNLAAALLSADFRDTKTVAIPAPGCSNGGLDWAIIKPMILEKLAIVSQLVRVYEPR